MEPSVNAFDKNSRKPFEAGRTPYDGLRPWSAITHGIGIALALVGTVFLMIHVVPRDFTTAQTVGFAVYGISMAILYTASTLYHSVNTTERGRILLRKADHTAVYLLIAGSYTPLCLTILAGTLGYALLATIWALTIVGAVLSFTWINMPRKLTAGIYISLGWLAVIALPFIYQRGGMDVVFWILLGGIFYTVGAIMYALKWPGRNNPRFGCHEIFHVFILFGSITHYVFNYHCLGG